MGKKVGLLVHCDTSWPPGSFRCVRGFAVLGESQWLQVGPGSDLNLTRY
jgi:hypothetical protein